MKFANTAKNVAITVMVGLDKSKEALDRTVDKTMDKFEELAVRADYLKELSAAEHRIKKSNPDLYDALPEVLDELNKIHGLQPSEVARALKTVGEASQE